MMIIIKRHLETLDRICAERPFSAQDHSFSWDFGGWTAHQVTWELDQLQINGEPVTVPMVAVKSDKTVTETTTLSTGTKITISVTSNRGDNGSSATRRYRMDVENCYENLTVSAGNLVGYYHKELVFKHLNGVSDPQYYQTRDGQGSWIALKPGSLVERVSSNNVLCIPYALRKRTAIRCLIYPTRKKTVRSFRKMKLILKQERMFSYNT